MRKKQLTISYLIDESRKFCVDMSKKHHREIVGMTDGKRIGTYIEREFNEVLQKKYVFEIGNAASGIDFPGETINTDMKVTSIMQPQSSCPFREARQKIYGLGYNILLFIYDKNDKKRNNLQFLHARFIEKERTADYQTTRGLLEIIERNGNAEDISAFLMDRNLPIDEISLRVLSEEILKNPPILGYLTISNVLQWRLQYKRTIDLPSKSDGLIKIYDR